MEALEDYNIILINLDGLRFDKLDLCPTLKSLKEDSYFFSNMHTVAPYTFASLHAIFSGMYPSRNGVNGYYNIFKFKNAEITSLSSFLQQSGYYTCCDIIDESVIPRQGFSEYRIFDEKTVDFEKRHKDLIKEITEKRKKFFMFLHYTETHKHLVREIVEKYNLQSNDDEYFNSREENEKRFNSYLPHCDKYIHTILETLNEIKIANKTILIIFSDHGMSLGEKKGEKFYGVYTYDYTIKVFCIVKIPQINKKIIEKQCRTIDLFPTICEIAGLDVGKIEKIQGQSILDFIRDESLPDREVFVETGGLYGFWPSPTKPNVFCVKINNKKLIYNDTPCTWEFYDLKDDPEELRNIYDQNSDEIRFFKSRLFEYFKENNIKTKINN